MKIYIYKTLVIVTFVLLFSCENTVDRKSTEDYYSSIVSMTEKQDSSYQEFLSTFKNLTTKANESTGRRLNSTDHAMLIKSYENFMDRLNTDKKFLRDLKEVDNEINLKYHIEKHTAFVDSSMHSFMPKVFHYLEISLDSADTKFWNEFDNLRLVVEKEQSERKVIDELAETFKKKHF